MGNSVFFWIAWGIVSSWVLRTYYFTSDKKKIQKLKKVAFGIDLSVLLLFFLPWLPPALGSKSGWELIFGGNILVALLGLLILFSTCAFLSNKRFLLKSAVAFHLSASVLFIVTMITLMPGTWTLTLSSIAPILASLLLLCGNIFALLIWHHND